MKPVTAASRARRQATVVAAFGAVVPTILAAQGMTSLAMDLLGFSFVVAVALAGFLELALVSSALLARAAALAGRPGGADAVAVWVVSATSGVLSGLHELIVTNAAGTSAWQIDPGSMLAAAVRAVAPLVAAWLWERVLQAARAEQAERTLAEVRRDRRLLDVARAALVVRRLDALNDGGPPSWRLRRARRHLDKAHLAALRATHPGTTLTSVLTAVGQVDHLPAATSAPDVVSYSVAALKPVQSEGMADQIGELPVAVTVPEIRVPEIAVPEVTLPETTVPEPVAAEEAVAEVAPSEAVESTPGPSADAAGPAEGQPVTDAIAEAVVAEAGASEVVASTSEADEAVSEDVVGQAEELPADVVATDVVVAEAEPSEDAVPEGLVSVSDASEDGAGQIEQPVSTETSEVVSSEVVVSTSGTDKEVSVGAVDVSDVPVASSPAKSTPEPVFESSLIDVALELLRQDRTVSGARIAAELSRHRAESGQEAPTVSK